MSPRRSDAGTVSAVLFTSTTRPQHDVEVSEPYGLVAIILTIAACLLAWSSHRQLTTYTILLLPIGVQENGAGGLAARQRIQFGCAASWCCVRAMARQRLTVSRMALYRSRSDQRPLVPDAAWVAMMDSAGGWRAHAGSTGGATSHSTTCSSAQTVKERPHESDRPGHVWLSRCAGAQGCRQAGGRRLR